MSPYTPAEVAATRHLTGLTQAEFAAAVGVSRQTLTDWTRGKFRPSGDAETLLAAIRAEHDAETKRLVDAALDGIPIGLPSGPRPTGWYLALGARILDRVPDAIIDWA